ncbi:MAG: iron complex transport system substrate-binding protein [Blastocatellia bacterium]|nr:iron complex transport system substrate-binding protein [Blastocatellia bacterium]
MALLLAACSRPPNNVVSRAETRQVVDESGRTVNVPTQVTRLVTLAPNLTEIVFAIGAGGRVVGNTTYCDYPAAAKQVAKVGDTLQPSVERIIALHPQLILVSTASQLEAFTRQLDGQGIAVYVTDPHDLEGMLQSISALGDLLNESEAATRLVNDLRARIAATETRVKETKPVTVFYQLSPEPLYTAGRDSFVTDLIRRAGGISVTRDVPGAWPRYSAESAIAAQPEAIIMATAESMGGSSNAGVAAALNKSPAAVAGRVYKINGDYLSRPGPRLVDGLEQIARALHPDAFK